MRPGIYYKNIKSALLIFLFIFITGCEQDIDLNIPTSPPQIVIEGFIENGAHPYVSVTRSSPFLSTISRDDLLDYTVTNAIVTVSDGTTTDTLTFSIQNKWPYLYYGTQKMVGEEGKYYHLRVEADGKVITSTTKLPGVIKLDSVWFKVDGTRDSLGFAWAHLTDPDSLGNSYRWFAKRFTKDDDFIAPRGSVFEDKFINGKSFDFAYNRGRRPNSEEADDVNEERGFFKKGDTIVVKFCSIDRDHFQFWRSLESQRGNNGNPFASPAPINGNIEGGLGIWGAYAAYFDTIIAR